MRLRTSSRGRPRRARARASRRSGARPDGGDRRRRAADAGAEQGRYRLDAGRDLPRPDDVDPRPRAVLRRPRAHEEHAVAPDPGVRDRLPRLPDLGLLRLQPVVHQRPRPQRLRRRLLEGLPARRDAGHDLADLLERRRHPGIRLHVLPDDLRDDHPGADRRRLRGADEVLGPRAVHGPVGDLHLFPDRPHGLVLGRPRRHRRRREGARGRRRRDGKERRGGASSPPSRPTPGSSTSGAGSTSPAAPSCTSTPASPASSAA